MSNNGIEYELGQAVRLVASFVDANQVAADPTTIAFKYGVQLVSPPPDPTATTVTFPTSGFTKDSVGNYHYDFVPAVPGNYTYVAIGTGTVASVSRGYFRVKPSPFA
jgi:hypothetical protein